MAVDDCLTKLCTSAGPKVDEALALLSKLLQNIADHPGEPKFRRLNTTSAKLQSGLLCHAGAQDFLAATGFVAAGEGVLELPPAHNSAFIDGRSAVIRRTEALQRKRQADQMSDGASQVASGYRSAVDGGAHGAGLAEISAIAQQPGGPEALALLERILTNVRRYPDSPKYRSVSLAKAGQRLLPAAPLLQLAGFQQQRTATGEECLQLQRPNSDVLERIWAMVHWATQPRFTLEPQPVAGRSAHALGALLGAAVGDALGAPLGGKGPYEVSAEEVDKVMEMCGGGIWGVAPGQATGNTELVLCLTEGLAEAQNPLKYFPMEDLAVRYGRWGRSQPFRGERACLQAFSRMLPADDLIAHAKDQNQKSMGSGALVRCAPLVALPAAPAALATLARADAKLSHPSVTLGYASGALVVAAAQLAATGGDRASAIAETQRWCEREHAAAVSGVPVEAGPAGWTHLATGKETEEQAWVPPGEQIVACEQVAGWLGKALSGKGQLPFSLSTATALLSGEVGSVEIPLMHAFRHLKAGSSFEVAMRAVLAGGGDASTNATVVGALIGAAVGVSGIPQRWLQAVLTADPGLGQPRPPEYHPKQLPGFVQKLAGSS